MDTMRKPVFVIAFLIGLAIVSVEIGAHWFPKGDSGTSDSIVAQLARIDPALVADMNSVPSQQLKGQTPPGVGIPDLALLDGLLLFGVGVIGAPFLLTDRVIGRIQGLLTLIVSLLMLIFSVIAIFTALAKVLLMIGLFVAAPFGTIAYMAKWGFFDKGGAAALLSMLLLLKLVFAGCLVLAHQCFLQNKGLVLMLITSLVANLIVSFLHGLVPRFLMSITDGIAGIVVLILVAIWAIVLLIGSIIAVRKAVA